MGNNSSSTPRPPNPPEGIVKRNEYVWELKSPTGTEAPSVEIIFFHGLQLGEYEDAFWKTWLVRDNDQLVWPKEWLGQSFPDARILSISYNSTAFARNGQTDMHNLGENLITNIIYDSRKIGQKSPVVFVGHSLGGIAIKQFILSALQMQGNLDRGTHAEEIQLIGTFLNNLKGVFYYGTPHQGSAIADYARHIPGKSPYLTLLKTLDADMGRINEAFRVERVNVKAVAWAIGEGRATGYRFFPAVHVVPEGSARHDVDKYYTSTTSDHFNVCRPSDMETDTIYTQLCKLVIKVVPGIQITIPEEEGQRRTMQHAQDPDDLT